MKKILFILLFNMFIPLAFANLPLPAPSSGGLVQSMQAQQELQRRYIEMKMMQEQLAMMQQQRAMMEMQPAQQKAPFYHKKTRGY